MRRGRPRALRDRRPLRRAARARGRGARSSWSRSRQGAHDAPRALAGEEAAFDLVFVTWGALGWLPDLAGWGGIVARFLKPGGALYLAEAHPAALVFENQGEGGQGEGGQGEGGQGEGGQGERPGWFVPYFHREPIPFDDAQDYAGEMARVEASRAIVFQRLAYDPLTDFVPIGEIGTNPMVLLVSRQSGIASVEQMRARGRAGRLSVGSSGVGTTRHMGGVMVRQAIAGGARADNVALIPYRGGGPAINDLLGGVLDVVVDQAITAIPAIDGGARPLAVMGPCRLPRIAEVPTTAEAGLPALDLSVWNILAAPRGTPGTVVGALADATVRARFATYGAIAPEGAARGPEAAAALVRREAERWGVFIRGAGIEREG